MSGTITPIGSPAILVAEDGTGKSTANSYLSVAAANTYHTTFTGSADWTAATASAKEAALIRATQYIDAEYVGRWRGYRASDAQALAWPRSSARDEDGYAIDDACVPQKLQAACAELALRVVLGDSLLGVVTQPGDVASESKTLGPISKTVTYVGGRPDGGYRYPKVEALLRGITQEPGLVMRG